MRAGDLVGRGVVDAHGRPLGVCTDVRCSVTQGPADTAPTLTVVGLLVSPHHVGSLLGYERGRTKGPWPLRLVVQRLHRGMVFVAWDEIGDVPNEHDRDLVLRPSADPTAL